MVSAFQDVEFFTFNAVNYSMLMVYPAAPKTGQLKFQSLRLTDPLIRRSLNSLNQLINLFENLPIILLPVKIILPSVWMKYYFQSSTSMSSFSSPLPS